MQRPKKVRKSGVKLQSFTNQPLDLVKEVKESRNPKDSIL